MALSLKHFMVFQCKYVRCFSKKMNFKHEFKQDVESNRFILQYNGNHAYIEYNKFGKLYSLKDLGILEEHKGMGIGTILAEKTFEHIINEKALIYIESRMLPNRLNQAKVIAQHGLRELSSRPEEQLHYKFEDDKSDKFKLLLGPESGYAFIEYTKIGKTYVLHHAETPKELRGRGIARILAEKTFNHIIEQDERIIIECTYLQDFFKKNEAKFKKHAEIAD